MRLSIELDREDDGRWIAEVIELTGVMTYGVTREEAICNSERLAIEVIAGRIQHGELPATALNVSFQVLSEQLAGDKIETCAGRALSHRLAGRTAKEFASSART